MTLLEYRGYTVTDEKRVNTSFKTEPVIEPFTVYDPSGVAIHTQDEETIEEIKETIDNILDYPSWA